MNGLALRGRLAELQKKKTDLAVRIRALVKAIGDECALSYIQSPESINADGIASLADDLAVQRREYREVLDLIKEIEREL